MSTAEILFFPILSIVTLVTCYVAASIIVSNLGISGENANVDSFFVNERDAIENYFYMDSEWLNKNVYIQFDNVNLITAQTFYIDLIDPSTVPEGTKVTIFNNPGSTNDPNFNIVSVNFQPQNFCQYQYVYDDLLFKCGYCQFGYTYTHPNINNPPQCLDENQNPGNPPILIDPIFVLANLGSGQGVTLITHRSIPFAGFYIDNNNPIAFDLTPPALQLKTWKIFEYINNSCNDVCSNLPNSNLQGQCTNNTQCPNTYPLDPNSVPNTGDADTTAQQCLIQKCSCPNNTYLPFCTN